MIYAKDVTPGSIYRIEDEVANQYKIQFYLLLSMIFVDKNHLNLYWMCMFRDDYFDFDMSYSIELDFKLKIVEL